MLSTHQRISKALVIICIVALCSPIVAFAQDGLTTQKLREQIALMEKIDKDSTASDEVRALNRELLAEKRAQLATRLNKEIDSLRQELDALRGSTPAATASSPAPPVQPNNTPGSTTPVAVAADTQVVSNHPEPASAPQDFVAACFPDAPQGLNNAALDAARRFLNNRDFTSQFGDLTYFALTHGVAIQAGREDLLEDIKVKQLQEQTRRTDKQIGAGANAAGSTSAIEKPNFAEILGFAVEHGAIQQAINGTTLSLSTTPYLFTTLNGEDTQSDYKKYGYLTRLGVSANFNIQNEDDPLASARRRQLTDWSVRLRLSKDRSTRSDDVEEIWNDIKGNFARPSIVITDALRATFQNDAELEAQRRQIADRFQALLAEQSVKTIRDNQNLQPNEKENQIAEKIVCRIKEDLVDPIINGTGTFKISQDSKDRIVRVTLPAFAAALTAKQAALKEFDERVEALSLKPIFSLAYNNIKPTIGSNYSEVKVLYQKKTFDPISLVANAGVSFYHKENPLLKQKTLRDFSVSLSLEGTAGRSPFMLESKDDSQITYSFTGRFERLFENRYFADRKADIAVAQFKLNIPMMSGMSFPFSVTYANSSELIKESKVRANFGFTFDTDKLLKALALSKLR